MEPLKRKNDHKLLIVSHALKTLVNNLSKPTTGRKENQTKSILRMFSLLMSITSISHSLVSFIVILLRSSILTKRDSSQQFQLCLILLIFEKFEKFIKAHETFALCRSVFHFIDRFMSNIIPKSLMSCQNVSTSFSIDKCEREKKMWNVTWIIIFCAGARLLCCWDDISLIAIWNEHK